MGRNDLIRMAFVPVGVDWMLNNLVSYRSEMAMYEPSSEMADEIRLVRSYTSVKPRLKQPVTPRGGDDSP